MLVLVGEKCISQLKTIKNYKKKKEKLILVIHTQNSSLGKAESGRSCNGGNRDILQTSCLNAHPQVFLKNLRGSPDLSKTGDLEAKSLNHAAEERSMLLCVPHM